MQIGHLSPGQSRFMGLGARLIPASAANPLPRGRVVVAFSGSSPKKNKQKGGFFRTIGRGLTWPFRAVYNQLKKGGKRLRDCWNRFWNKKTDEKPSSGERYPDPITVTFPEAGQSKDYPLNFEKLTHLFTHLGSECYEHSDGKASAGLKLLYMCTPTDPIKAVFRKELSSDDVRQVRERTHALLTQLKENNALPDTDPQKLRWDHQLVRNSGCSLSTFKLFLTALVNASEADPDHRDKPLHWNDIIRSRQWMNMMLASDGNFEPSGKAGWLTHPPLSLSIVHTP